MKPGRHDTIIRRGSIWEETYTWKAPDGSLRNLTGFSAAMLFAPAGEEFASPNTLIVVAVPALSNNAQIHCKMLAAATLAIPEEEYRLRLMITEPDGDVYPLLEGLAPVR